VFTRIVNDLLHRHGTSGDLSSVGDEGAGSSEPLQPTLKVGIEMSLGKKTSPVQYLRTIRPTLPRGQEHVGKASFVNQASLMFRLGLSHRV
jgi:hypothetical protein